MLIWKFRGLGSKALIYDFVCLGVLRTIVRCLDSSIVTNFGHRQTIGLCKVIFGEEMSTNILLFVDSSRENAD